MPDGRHPMQKIRVVGSGPVALAFAALARRQGIAANAIELARHDGQIPSALAQRVLALSQGSWQLLSRFAKLPPCAPIQQVDVVMNALPGRVRLTASEMQVPALGYVVRYATLMHALQQGVQAGGTQAGSLPSDASAREAASSHDDTIIVHAQGEASGENDELQFEQAALLAEVQFLQNNHSRSGREPLTAFECFTSHGPLALLPLPEPNRYSLVWCDQPQQTDARAALPGPELAQQLQQAFGWKLGQIQGMTSPQVVPMFRRARRQLVQGRQVWIGNAAQALHPVAGQGLNLGIRDAFELAQQLGNAHAAGTDMLAALQAYARQRRTDRSLSIGLTDALARMFSLDLIRPFQSIALGALDLSPNLRRLVASHFMFGWR